MRDTSTIEVDLGAVERNIRAIRRMVGGACAICPILKADGYGMGAATVARPLSRAGCGMFAVYSLGEAIELLAAGLEAPVLVLSPVRRWDDLRAIAPAVAAGRAHLAVHDLTQLRNLAALAGDVGGVMRLHLEIDTGMSRGGCGEWEAGAIMGEIARHPGLALAGVATHFASADSDEALTGAQMTRFEALLEAHRSAVGPDCAIHVANSFATLRGRRFHRSMVRIGLAWTGHGPEWMRGGHCAGPGADDVAPVMRWTSRIVMMRAISPGTTVGYGAMWMARRPTTLAVVPVGYADGYPMTLCTTDRRQGPACVGVLDRHDESAVRGYAPVVGAVSMDQLTIDVTDMVGRFGAAVGIETPVELISREPARAGRPNHLAALARAAGTIPHELLCRINPRIRRVYHEAALAVQTVESKPAVVARA